MAQQYTLPEWARQAPYLLAGPNNPALTGTQIGNSSVSGGGMGLLDTQGFYDAGIGQFTGRVTGGGDSQGWEGGKYDEFNDWLRSTGQSLFEANGGGNINAKWLQDAQGNITAEPQFGSLDDDNFGIAAMLAGAVTGANLYGAYGGAAQAGGASSGGQGGFGAFGNSAPLDAGFSIPSFEAGGASSGGLLSGAAPSGAGAAGAGGSTLFGNSQLGQAANGLLDYAKSNPKLIGGLLGGLTGATGGLDSGGGAAPYTGPMPTIERGGWKPRVQAQQMALPQFGGAKTTPGAAGSGLWRFMGGK